MTDISQAIATAVEFEKFGVEFYRRFEKLVDDKDAFVAYVQAETRTMLEGSST